MARGGPNKGELTKDQRISEEYARMKDLFAAMAENELRFCDPLLQNAAFMKVTLEDLQQAINENGVTDQYQNGANQSGTKASADLLVMAYHRTYGLPCTISRCSNNYGPFQFPEKLIPLIISRALNDQSLPVYGDGKNVRDWLYVEDHCKAIDLIVHKGRIGEVYNVGGHNEMANIDIVKLIIHELGKDESLITYVTDRKGHDLRYAIDPTKIHEELGWLPETKFADGIKKTIKWYLDNRSWWEEIISGEYQNYYKKMYGQENK